MGEIICSEGKGTSWVVKEEFCIGQDEISVECECNTIGCRVMKNIFIDVSEGVEDFNDE